MRRSRLWSAIHLGPTKRPALPRSVPGHHGDMHAQLMHFRAAGEDRERERISEAPKFDPRRISKMLLNNASPGNK